MARCIGRVRYPTRKAAEDICNHRNVRNAELSYPLRWGWYECKRCSGFHVSSTKVKV